VLPVWKCRDRGVDAERLLACMMEKNRVTHDQNEEGGIEQRVAPPLLLAARAHHLGPLKASFGVPRYLV
jgi:hypothetical protein